MIYRTIPAALTTLRVVLGPLACWLATVNAPGWTFAFVLLAALLSDIYDGVLARRWGIATEFLRRYDSLTDLFYYACILWSTWRVAHGAVEPYGMLIASLVTMELAVIAVSLLRFGKMPATHSYGAKLYGLALFTAFFCLLVLQGPAWVVPVTVGIGLLADAEILLILCLARQPPVDVKSVLSLPK